MTVFYHGGVGGGGAVPTGELWACFLEEVGFTPWKMVQYLVVSLTVSTREIQISKQNFVKLT